VKEIKTNNALVPSRGIVNRFHLILVGQVVTIFTSTPVLHSSSCFLPFQQSTIMILANIKKLLFSISSCLEAGSRVLKSFRRLHVE
jgi:hypothetical protein